MDLILPGNHRKPTPRGSFRLTRGWYGGRFGGGGEGRGKMVEGINHNGDFGLACLQAVEQN